MRLIHVYLKDGRVLQHGNMHLISELILLKVQDQVWMLCSTLVWSMAMEAFGGVTKEETLYCVSCVSSFPLLQTFCVR